MYILTSAYQLCISQWILLDCTHGTYCNKKCQPVLEAGQHFSAHVMRMPSLIPNFPGLPAFILQFALTIIYMEAEEQGHSSWS